MTAFADVSVDDSSADFAKVDGQSFVYTNGIARSLASEHSICTTGFDIP